VEASRNFEWIVLKYLRPVHNQFVRAIKDGIATGEFPPWARITLHLQF